MKVIFLGGGRRKSRTYRVGRSALLAGFAGAVVLPAILGIVLGLSIDRLRLSEDDASQGLDLAGIDSFRKQLVSAELHAQHKIQALTIKLAQLQARMLRLDAVGEQVTGLAGLDKGEFDFGEIPAVGGPEQEGQVAEEVEISAIFKDLEKQINQREYQLDVLKNMMGDRNVERESTIAGRPVVKGWLSSGYGMRTDPFNGRQTRHKGVDFAGKEGSEVIAVAAGLVTQSKTQKGFGRLVEIDHGDGLVTRYAHNRENLVEEGDIVKKGQVIALMGKTGRSTGPHVHFEVTRHGKVVNPARYIHRTLL